MSDKHPPQQTVSSSEAGAPEATILRGTSKATTPPLRGTPPYQEGSRKNSPPEKGEYPEGGRGLIPKLRFPEFREAGEWDEKKLFQVCEINPSVNTLPETFVYIDLESVEQGKLLQKKTILRKSAPSRAQRLLKPGDIIFQMVRPYQKNNYFFMPDDDHDYVASTGYAQLRANQSNKYLFHYLHNDKFVRRVLEQCTGSNYPAINSSDLSAILVELPEQNEQQKIADCLSSLDTLITAQTEKIDALKTHKKGLMQQLFPQDGETVPRLRFSEFREAGEWEEKVLVKTFKIFQGYAFSSSDSTKKGVRWLKIADVGIQRMDPDTPSYLPQSFKDEYRKFSVRMGDYVIALTRPILSRQLKIAKVDPAYDGALLNQRVGKLVSRENLDFIYFLLQTEKLISDIDKNISGNDPPNLSSQQIGDIGVRIPSLSEQQKIADCLSSLDVLVSAEQEKLDALKTHKKGLMQQLFPAVENEVGS